MAFSPVLGDPKPQVMDALGDPYVGLRYFFYAAGTSTKQDTQTDSTGAVNNTNPVVFDAEGYPTGNVMIYGANNLGYKVVCAPPGTDDPPAAPLWTIDNIFPGATVDGEWINPNAANYTSATSFTIVGVDVTAIYEPGQKVFLEDEASSANNRFATIETAVFGADTVITVTSVVTGASPPVPSTLHADMDTAYISILSQDDLSIPEHKRTETGMVYFNHATFHQNRHINALTDTDFSASGTAAANTTALQAAIDTNVPVYVPAGNYDINALTMATENILYGDGPKRTILQFQPVTGDGITFDDNAGRCQVHGLKVWAENASTGTGIISDNGSGGSAREPMIDQFEIEGFLGGIYLPDALNPEIGQGRVIGQGAAVAGGYGIKLGDAATAVNGGTVRGTYLSSVERGYWLETGQGLSILSPIIETVTDAFYSNEYGYSVTSPYMDSAFSAGSAYMINAIGTKPISFINPTLFVSGSRKTTLEPYVTLANSVRNKSTLDLNVRSYFPTGSQTNTGGDFVLSAGFGATASVLPNREGSATRGRFTVTSAGADQAANPTITLTFPFGETYLDDADSAAPYALVMRNGGDQPDILNTWVTTTTTLVITFVGTPVAAETYDYEYIIMP